MILVNKYGRRAVNEKRDYADRTMAHFHWDPVRAEWTNMLTFMIFDQRIATLWRGVPPIRVPERPSPYVIVGKNLVVLERLLVERLEALQQYTGKAYPGPQLRY
jgi:3-oxosteroid 1-dehydrogenase